MNNQKQPGKIRRSWQLLKSSVRVLKLDKELLALPIIEVIISVSALAAIGLATFGVGYNQGLFGAVASQREVNGAWLLVPVIFYVMLVTFIAHLFAGAIIHAAFERFDGEDPTARGSLGAAWRKKGSIFKFSTLTATIALVLDFIRQRVPFAGDVITWLGEATWAVASFFALPYIVRSEQKLGPINATKQSLSLVRKVWGESLAVNFGIGLIAVLGTGLYGLITVPIGIVLMGASMAVGIVFALLAVIGLIAALLALSVISSIAKAAIFYWATTGKAPADFNQSLLRAAMTPKKARKVFTS